MFNKRICMLLMLQLLSFSVYPDDLDGGIGGDEAIKDDLQIEPNIAFIKRDAKAKAKQGTAETNASGGVGNISSTCTKNCTIVNLSENKGATSVSESK